MRSRTAKWFECTCQYEKTMEDGLQKKVKETNVVDALSFTEAEKRFIEEMSSYISGEFDVTAMKIAQYKEVFFNDADESADRWYKVKLDFITINEKTEKEQHQKVTYLFQAGSFEQAKKAVVEVMGGTMIDYVILKIEETNLWSVFEYAKKESETEE
jgi:hypothetical protein